MRADVFLVASVVALPGRHLVTDAGDTRQHDAQDLTNQREQLAAAGCSRIFAEKVTGTRRDRPELARLLDHLRPGDVVTVTRLDRLARFTRDLLDIAERIQAAGAGLRSLAEPWADTTSPAGRMVLTVFAGIAEFERELIRERTKHGREAAKARGVKFGPPPTLTAAQIAHARELIEQDRPIKGWPACWACTDPRSTAPSTGMKALLAHGIRTVCNIKRTMNDSASPLDGFGSVMAVSRHCF